MWLHGKVSVYFVIILRLATVFNFVPQCQKLNFHYHEIHRIGSLNMAFHSICHFLIAFMEEDRAHFLSNFIHSNLPGCIRCYMVGLVL